ncbi:ubiquinone anaerobic biosynthesis accessory factor UbiT [Pseudorhodobacter ferrugineus]|uniref:ubiquinone anaerobic biosynthesis accessory factor UbiT n=1 Tax=Pseudorhodobacter ferrugineus TaxID=77008 RepID=UPI0003B577DE|nr:SCP2 sterol-binding domain-containing protein [Pseudorhodobacter ferrugineus]
MQSAPFEIEKAPPLVAFALRPLPLPLLSKALTALTRSVAGRHPSMFRRLGPFASARFVLDPTDLPFVICLSPDATNPHVILHRSPQHGDAKIAGPLAALLGLVHGAFDGDALFFSRDLVIEGNTEAALALRNAIDDAELDIGAELQAMSGPFAGPLRRAIILAQALTGLCLKRPENGGYC